MASASRKELEAWLKTIEVSGRVLDVGGARWSIKGRAKTWEVDDYSIMDRTPEDKAGKTDYLFDLNEPIPWTENYDVAFCIEMMQFVYHPVQVLKNIHAMLKEGGILYIDFHTVFMPCKGTDYLRYTEKGVRIIMEKSKFLIEEYIPRYDGTNEITGAFVKCRKCQ